MSSQIDDSAAWWVGILLGILGLVALLLFMLRVLTRNATAADVWQIISVMEAMVR